MMLKIAAHHVEAIHAADSPRVLHDLVQSAIRLEHATIPPYLTAMLSIVPGSNQEVWNIIHSIVVDEMLHMSIGCNLLNAIGGNPQIYDPAFVPTYPGPLPMGIGSDLCVSLEPVSVKVVDQVFMKIEEPEQPIPIPAAAMLATPQFATIGQFYGALISKIEDFGDDIFAGDASRQVFGRGWFPEERLFPITGAETAVAALRLIVEEGEGNPDSPLDPEGDIAHFYRFREIVEGRRLVRDSDSSHGYSYSGSPINLDMSNVYPMNSNQLLEALDVGSEARRRANQFSFTYTKLLNALQQTFDGDPAFLDQAMGIMFELKLIGQKLCDLPAITNGQNSGKNAGPTFAFTPFNI